jgi:hypothetical protein
LKVFDIKVMDGQEILLKEAVEKFN